MRIANIQIYLIEWYIINVYYLLLDLFFQTVVVVLHWFYYALFLSIPKINRVAYKKQECYKNFFSWSYIGLFMKFIKKIYEFSLVDLCSLNLTTTFHRRNGFLCNEYVWESESMKPEYIWQRDHMLGGILNMTHISLMSEMSELSNETKPNSFLHFVKTPSLKYFCKGSDHRYQSNILSLTLTWTKNIRKEESKDPHPDNTIKSLYVNKDKGLQCHLNIKLSKFMRKIKLWATKRVNYWI